MILLVFRFFLPSMDGVNTSLSLPELCKHTLVELAVVEKARGVLTAVVAFWNKISELDPFVSGGDKGQVLAFSRGAFEKGEL